MTLNNDFKKERLGKVLVLDLTAIDSPACLEHRQWRDAMLPRISRLETITPGTSVDPVILTDAPATIEVFRAYRFGVKGYDEPIFVKAPIPEQFNALVDGIVAAQMQQVIQLKREVAELKLELSYATNAMKVRRR